MQRRLRTVFRRPGSRGVAALEFALLAPALVVVAVSLYDATNAAITWWRLAQGAHAVDLIATEFAATLDSTNVLSDVQATRASTALYALQPDLAGADPLRFGVTLTSVVFTPPPGGCGANCAYTANVAWSATLQGGAPARACGTLSPAPDGARPSPTTLPSDAFGAAPLLLVDVVYDFTPLLTNLFAMGFTMRQAAYLSPRTGGNAQWIRYTGPTAAKAQCPGYAG